MSEVPELTVVDEPSHGRYEARSGERLAGFVTYGQHDGRLSLHHAEVDPAFEGRGVGGAMVRGVLADARKRGLAVLPFCPFVQRYLQRHPDWLDLVPVTERASFGLD